MITPLAKTAPAPRYLYVRTFGCQMNEYDSQRALRLLCAVGYRPTSDIAAADVIFLNTCSVRDKAEQKVYSFLGRLRRLKARRPWLKIVVAGCVAQQLGDGLLKRFEHVDLVVGTRGIGSIASLLEEVERSKRRVAHLPAEELQGFTTDECRTVGTGDVVAQVTIMQGCNNFCTYCIVPHVRGRERSRAPDDILREIDFLASRGAREVLLLGQNVNSYGRGLPDPISFPDLLRRIGNETSIRRVRFTTSHPKDLTEDLIECFAALPFLCKHLHLPFQSGSDGILKLMHRGYTARQYLEKIARLREVCPEIALSADVIVGFPAESEEDYLQTLRLIEAVRFDSLFSFRYSDRPLTRAAGFSDKVATDVKVRRLAQLQSMQADITLQKNLAETGTVREVLVEGPSKASNGQMTGRTQQNRIINFQCPVDLAGEIVPVRIVAAYSHSLKGELLSQPGEKS
ncbi:MAG TPA: tRNA (N6-isopentenyl adenosine(37)-C2)-methylthiotransferase MiaB [Syntrophobacter fumaroxidans]|nr:tRNA (N6-isopentenyl adenosine(37)-C2)-methylthiotransferase MiaB [Syntrophobacter fumaroxidans]